MQLQTRYTASLLTVIIFSISQQYPTQAQYARFGTSRYPKVISCLPDSSGNFLLLNLQSKKALAPPSIQYLPAIDGRTIMVATFFGAVWNQDPKLVKVPNELIDSVRIGQFQLRPPILRISITGKNAESLKLCEFRCQPKSLVIKFPTPTKKITAEKLPPAAPPLAQTIAAPVSPRTAPPVASKKNDTVKLKQTAATPASAPLSVVNPPFSTGGLFLTLGPDPAKSTSGPPAPLAGDDSTTMNHRLANNSRLAEKGHVDRAAAEKKTESTDVMPPKAPQINRIDQEQDRNDHDLNSPAAHSGGFASHFRSLFHRQNTAKKASAAQVDDQRRYNSETQEQAPAITLAAVTASAAEAKLSLTKPSELANTNPQLEFSGKDPFKIKLKFDAQIKYKAFKLDDPPRFVVDIEDQQCTYNQPPEPVANPWLKSVRIGNPEERLTRIVLDLNQANVRIKEECDQQQKTLLVTLGPETTAASPSKGREVVVIDAGHGGSDPGAQRGDIQEKEITLAIAMKLKRYLEAKGLRVIMTRSDDTFVSLEDRVRITNSSHPDAFVSIHINSLETDRDITGIETYYHSDQSHKLADKVHEQLVGKLKVPDRYVRRARFYVVNHTDRPAILAEVGFISNKDERDKLISSDYQANIAESLGQGVILYLADAGQAQAPIVSAPESKQAPLTGSTPTRLANRGQSAVKQQIAVENETKPKETTEVGGYGQIADSESRQKRKAD